MSQGRLSPREKLSQNLQNPNNNAQATRSEAEAQHRATATHGFASLRNEAAANKLFEEIGNGFAPPDDASQAQAVFNDLIEHEEYDTFVEVFNAYNAVREKQLLAPGEQAFKATLTLQLPRDWRPSDQKAFLAALRQVPVKRLEVLSTDSSPSHASSSKTPVPAAVCEGIAELLVNGTTELVVRGELSLPETVALAMGSSTCELRSLELGEENEPAHFTAEEKASYEALMDGGACSRTLEKLSFCRPDLVTLHEKLKALATIGGPVTSIELTAIVVSPSYKSDDLKLFMQGVNAFKALASFSLQCNALPYRILLECVLAPLKNHDALTRFTIVVPAMSYGGLEEQAAASEVLNFAATCPAMRHVKVLAKPMEAWSGLLNLWMPNVQKQPVGPADTDFARHRTFRLKTLEMSGFGFSPYFTSVFCELIADNETLEHLDVRGNKLSITMPLDFPSVVQNHKTIRHCLFPDDPKRYYYEHGDRVHGLTPDFGLKYHHNASIDEKFSAQEAFEKIRKNLAAAPTLTQAMLDAKHRAMANEALALSVGGVLQMISGLPTPAFNDIAQGVVPYLAGANNAKALRDIVHLSEVAKAADSNRLHAGGTTPESVKLVVKQANADAVAKGLDTAPLKVNTVDALHRNEALRAAILKDDAVAVRAALGAGAINFGGLNTRDVRSQKVMHALHPNASNTSNTSASVTASASTATTTTTTVTAPTGRTTSNTTATTNTTDTHFTPPPEEDPGSPKQG